MTARLCWLWDLTKYRKTRALFASRACVDGTGAVATAHLLGAQSTVLEAGRALPAPGSAVEHPGHVSEGADGGPGRRARRGVVRADRARSLRHRQSFC